MPDRDLPVGVSIDNFMMLGRRAGKRLFNVHSRSRRHRAKLFVIRLSSTPWHREQNHVGGRQRNQLIRRRPGMGDPVGSSYCGGSRVICIRYPGYGRRFQAPEDRNVHLLHNRPSTDDAYAECGLLHGYFVTHGHERSSG